MKYCFIVCFLLQFCSISGGAPVFIWSNDRTITFPQVIAGHSTSKKEFIYKYLDKVNGNLIVFAKDKLSVTDILIHGGVYDSSAKNANYEQLKAAMAGYSSTYLPNVENPVDSLIELSGRSSPFNLISLDPQDIESSLLKVNLKEKFLLIIDLSFGKNSKADHDEIIGKVVSYMKDKCIFTAFFTGRQSEEFRFEEVPVKHEKTRHLMEAQKLNVTPIISGSFIMIFDKLQVGNENFTVENLQVVDNGCDNLTNIPPNLANCTVTLSVPSQSYQSLNLSFHFLTSGPKNPGYWYVKETTVTFDDTQNITTVKMTKGYIDPTPIGFSYSCSRPPVLERLGVSEGGNFPRLQFTRLQMQIFRGNGTSFGYYNDCVGFFSIGIWMFLICAAILLAILAFGIIMLLGINTMDRYDDPKGKTISVPITD